MHLSMESMGKSTTMHPNNSVHKHWTLNTGLAMETGEAQMAVVGHTK